LIVGARSAANETNRFFGGKSPLLDKQTAGIQKFDAMVILRAFGAAKIQVAKNTKLTGEELNQAAAKLAEKAVRRTQPMYSAVHRTAVARTKNPMIKLWTAFTSVTSQILQMYKRSNMRFSRSKKSPEDLTKWLGSMLLIWLSSSLSMVGIDELKDRAFGRIPTWAKRLTGLLKYSTSPVYFGRNVTAITSDAIKFAESGKYSTWNSDMASHNLISGMAVEAGDAARDIVMGLLEDNPFSTQDYKRIQRGTLNGVMLVMKGWTGFSGRNLINYFYKLPKKFAERVSNVGRKLKTAQNEVEYHPRTGRYKTIEGQKYKIHGRAFKEYEQNVKKYSSQMFEKAFTDETWDVLDAETKKTQLKVFFDAAKYKAYYEIPESDRIEITKEEE